MMHVVDEKKWRRAKILFAWILVAIIIVCIGGLEGTEPMPFPELAMMLLPCLGYMVWNLTKHYNSDS